MAKGSDTTASDDERGGADRGADESNDADKATSSVEDTASVEDDDDAPSKEDESDSGPPLYKRPIFWIVVGVVATVVVLGGVLYWLHARKYVSTDDAYVDAHIVLIAAETTGRLTAVADADNHHPKAGELLAVIEPGGTEATRAEALAGIPQVNAQIRQAEAGVIAARASRAQAFANARVPIAEAERARRDYARYLDLRTRDPFAAAPTQIDQARAQVESAAAQAVAARRAVGTADAQILSALRQVDAARAERGAAVARLHQSDVTLSYLRIRAPIAGQVVNRQVNVGSYVAPGQQLLAIVPNRMWVTANFKETQLGRMKRGQPVRITIDAFPDLPRGG